MPASTPTPGAPDRFLVDDDNLVAGLGHLMASFNIGLKVALRHNLSFIPQRPGIWSASPLIRIRWAIHTTLRAGRNAVYDHQGTLDSAYRRFLHLDSQFPPRRSIDEGVRSGRLRLIQLPEPLVTLGSDAERYAEIDQIIAAHPEPGTVFALPPNRLSRCDAHYDATRARLRQLYLRARSLDPVRDLFSHSLPVRVAVNIRRGDIVRDSRYHGRLLPDSYYCHILNSLHRMLAPLPVQVAIFSDADSAGRYLNETGAYVDWKAHPLLNPGIPVTAHLDEHAWLEALDNMISADILITSRSGFSHLAAILSDGLKLACDMWLPFDATPNVVPVEVPSGAFPEEPVRNWLARQPHLRRAERIHA
jgi:hypothetical protein